MVQPLDPASILRLAEAAADLGSPDRGRHVSAPKAASSAVDEALATFLESNPEAALRLLAALPVHWEDLGRIDEGRRLTERAVAAWHEPPTQVFAMALVAAAELAFRQGDQDAAINRCRRAIDAAEACREPVAAAMAHVNLARAAFRAGDADGIERHATLALELGGSDPGARRGGLHMLAWAAHTAGDLPLAIRRFEDSLAYRRSLGDRFAVTAEIANLADLAAERGDLPGAAARLHEALVTAIELDSTYLVVNLLPSIAAIAAASGDVTAAARLIGATDAMTASTGLAPDPGAWQPAIDALASDHRDAFQPEREAGMTLGRDDAVELALAVAARVREPGA